MSPPLEQTIVSASQALSKNECTSQELTEAYLAQIRGLNFTLRAYLEAFEDHAMEMAALSDRRREHGEARGVLDGIPIAIKDNMLIAGEIASAGSRILEKYVAVKDATVIGKLREAGAVFLGRTNMDEFAMGSSTEHSAYGPTHHPRDLERVPGGSSGGSACAVAADLCVAALGSDTGGSIRQPAAFCGMVGMKPSYGRVSRSGLMAMASSLDQIGPMTKTVEDAAVLLNAIEGVDALDQTTVDFSPTTFARRADLRGIKIGLPRQAWGEGMTDGVRARVEEAVEQLRALGAETVDIELPYADEALAVYYVLMPCEVSANMARFDGIRYGARAADVTTLLETYLQSRGKGLGEEVRRRVMLGAYALSKGYYDAYYRQARKVQTLIRRAYAKAFADVDVLVTATTPSTAFLINEKTNDPLAMYLEDVYTVSVNVAGVPAISVPCGNVEGLPVGLQFISAHGEDSKLLSIADAFERLASSF